MTENKHMYMASTNISLSEEKFRCCNYCKGRIASHGDLSGFSQCPLCKKNFHRAPELRDDTEFAGEDSSSCARSGQVPCDLCHGMKAVKSCLVCLASYCNDHLKPHHTVPALKWHKLINPVETLKDRVCKKHDKVIELFCRKDQSCVCIECLKDDHMMHEAVSLEEEFKKRKTELKCTKRQVKHILTEKCIMVQRIEKSMKQGRQEVDSTKAETVKAFAALVASIESKKVKLIELLEEKQKAAEQKAEALIRRLQLEIAENNRMRTKLKELSKTEDDFRLLQGLPSVYTPSNTKHPFTARVQTLLHVETVRSAVAKMEEMLNKQMENITREVNLVDKEETAEEAIYTQTENVFDDELGKIQEQYAMEVTLDPNTAHPSLIVSEDRKQVRDGGTKRNVPDNPTRFDSLHFVLGNEGFIYGKFYYEVTLKGQTGWEVGVARESISRKGADLSLSPEKGCWTLGLYWGRCQANTNPPVILSLSKEPQKVGVFVDYEGGLVSFYDVDTRALIFSFTGCAFTTSVPLLSNFLGLRASARGKTKIYPLFRPSGDEGSNSAPLQINQCTPGGLAGVSTGGPMLNHPPQ
ncbi:E3 ubiquitin-protein ligase TRIM39-like [Enoplosus armatus]|uniref:E3 ubiquitin-protein ligase TRIM39-like n=1 Tax=Enoplosus armatus TaxID=215367 RepID=UPI003991CBC0